MKQDTAFLHFDQPSRQPGVQTGWRKSRRALAVTISTIVWAGFAFIARPADNGEASSSAPLHIVRDFAAPREQVFRAWTDAESIRQWFPYHAGVHWTDPPTDATPGGHFGWIVASDDNEKEIFAFHGTYREVQPPEKLAFSWNWAWLPIPGVEAPGRTLVTLEFLSKGEDTTVILTQTGFANEAARQAHEKGWNRCLDGIQELLRAKP